MTLVTKRVTAAVSPASDDGPGEFDIILSTAARDREGEIVSAKSWKLPLPERISINADHSPSISDVIGSGRPFIDENGNLRVKGVFSSSPAAQHIRALVNEGHVRSVSVEMLRVKGVNGEPLNELVGGAFVSLPANPQARVLASKSAFDAELDKVIKAAPGGDMALMQAAHDAIWHLSGGAVCPVYTNDPDNDGDVDDQGMDGTDGADDGANKAAALKLRVKALAR